MHAGVDDHQDEGEGHLQQRQGGGHRQVEQAHGAAIDFDFDGGESGSAQDEDDAEGGEVEEENEQAGGEDGRKQQAER